MAYTTFQKTFWTDDYILNLSKDEKLTYAYLITNDKSQQCGIYELSMAKVCLELAMRTEELLMILKKFSDDKKICYSMETQEVCIINWIKHNENKSWRTMEGVKKQLANIKNPALMLILYDPRQPLFSGVKKVKGVETPYTIDNPWKEYFKALSDSDLLEIREPYCKNKAPYKPLTSPLYGASHITEQNRTYTEQNIPYTKTEHELPKPNRIDNDLIALIEKWNSCSSLPTWERSIFNIPDKEDVISGMIDYSQDTRMQAVINYGTIASDPENYELKPEYMGLTGFLKTGIDKYKSSSNPFDRCKIKTSKQDNIWEAGGDNFEW